MLASTVFTTCPATVALFLLTAVPVQASGVLPVGAVQRAASKASSVLTHLISKVHVSRQTGSYTPADPYYLNDVLSWVCDPLPTVDQVDQCTTNLSVFLASWDAWADANGSPGILPSIPPAKSTVPRLRMSSLSA